MNLRYLSACRIVVAVGLAGLVCFGRCLGDEPRFEVRGNAPASRPEALAELRDFTLAGMDRRLGPGYDFYHRQGPAEKFPEVWMAPAKLGPGQRRWQIGGPWTSAAGDFSSTQGQVLYVPDPGFFPVDRVTILEWSNGCFTESPEPPWHGGFRPEPASTKWKQAAAHGDVGMPIAMARGMGYWANNGLAVFSSGLLAAAGTVTARGLEPTFQFPPNKLPTAISITNKSEFVLVTVHDTEKHAGQVAVLSPRVAGKTTGFVHEWHDDQAWSLPSVALMTNLKLLGYVDLPGIEFPTGVSAVGNKLGGRMNGRDGNAGLLREYDLARQADRDVFLKGPNSQYGSTAGYAVVVGKYENKAALLDLRPLFQKVREMYFTTRRELPQDPRCRPGAAAMAVHLRRRATMETDRRPSDRCSPSDCRDSRPARRKAAQGLDCFAGRKGGRVFGRGPGRRRAGAARRIRPPGRSAGRPQRDMPGLPEGFPRHVHCRFAGRSRSGMDQLRREATSCDPPPAGRPPAGPRVRRSVGHPRHRNFALDGGRLRGPQDRQLPL